MKSAKAWLAKKFIEPCACSSGRSYHQCCYRRESVYFVIGVLAALALFGARELPGLIAVVPILVLAAFATKLHYDRERKRK
jgi:disulfide bond formation protein DsbB